MPSPARRRIVRRVNAELVINPNRLRSVSEVHEALFENRKVCIHFMSLDNRGHFQILHQTDIFRKLLIHKHEFIGSEQYMCQLPPRF